MLPLLFYCFSETRSEQEVALSTAAISALMFLHSSLPWLVFYSFWLLVVVPTQQTDSISSFSPHCIPPRLLSSVVSSRVSFRCKAYWENAASCLVLHGTCGAFLFHLFCPVFSAVILLHFPFHYCQKTVSVNTFLFIYMPTFEFLDFSWPFLTFSWIDFLFLWCLLWCIVVVYCVLIFWKGVLWPYIDWDNNM